MSVAIALACAELALRVKHGKVFEWEDLNRPKSLKPLGGDPPEMFDSELGWIPRPGRHARRGGWVSTVGEDYLRSNGGSPGVEPSILTVGDSFTYGDEVDDHQTWSAYLETLTGRRVLNGGVSSYGLDQAVLRAERLIEEHDPGLVILAFIGDDIRRCELYFYTQWKPCFELEGSELISSGVPLPSGSSAGGVWKPTPPPGLGLLNYSHLARFLETRCSGRDWIGFWRAHDQGPDVASLLLMRLGESVRARGRELLVVALPQHSDPHREDADVVVRRALSQGLNLLDLRESISGLARGEDPEHEVWQAGGHLTPDMNARVARQIADHPLLDGGRPGESRVSGWQR